MTAKEWEGWYDSDDATMGYREALRICIADLAASEKRHIAEVEVALIFKERAERVEKDIEEWKAYTRDVCTDNVELRDRAERAEYTLSRLMAARALIAGGASGPFEVCPTCGGPEVKRWKCSGCGNEVTDRTLVIYPGNNFFYHEKPSGEICGRYELMLEATQLSVTRSTVQGTQ
jgi:hypothetical protein